MVTVDGVRMARRRMYFSSEKPRASWATFPRPTIETLRGAVERFSEQRLHQELKATRVALFDVF